MMISQHTPVAELRSSQRPFGPVRQTPRFCRSQRAESAFPSRKRSTAAHAAALALELQLAQPSFASQGAQAVSPPQPAGQPENAELGWPSWEGRYHLGKTLGQGSYGTCYIAIDKATGRACCVKKISKVRAKHTRDKVLRKLAAEVDFLTRVQDCLNVVQLYETFEDADHAYFVCELCSGGDLDSIVEKEGPLEEVAVARVINEVLKVLAACHGQRLVHGDIKPANFVMKSAHTSTHQALRTGQGLQGAWLKAVDFGCSQAVLPGSLTRRTGTPVFMAPEVYAKNYGLPADMWSCGIMMYQLMAKRFPFWATYEETKSKSVEEVRVAVQVAPIPIQGAPWLKLSPLGLDFLSGLLERDAHQRLTVQEALEHPWLKEQLGCSTAPPASYGNIVPLGPLSLQGMMGAAKQLVEVQ